MSDKWTEKKLPDLTGKTIIITGANSGTGYAATEFMATKGATVIMASRNPGRIETARKKIMSKNKNAKLDAITLDLGSLDSIKNFAKEFKEKYSSLDILICNAGVCQTPDIQTEDGFGFQMGINHLGHYALTGLLLDMLKNTKDSRVVTMSSMNHMQAKPLNFENLFLENEYHQMKAYEQSKLANLLFSYELSRKLADANVQVEAIAAHPGLVKSNIMKTNEHTKRSFGFKLMFNFFDLTLAMTPKKGSLGIMRAATDRSIKNGDYVGPTKMAGFRGYPELMTSSDLSYIEEDAQKLWEMSEQLTGIKYIFN
jgi:NAD(P)-dependent dehydrogenase (short-subunit alcohol dehydrogenase family)